MVDSSGVLYLFVLIIVEPPHHLSFSCVSVCIICRSDYSKICGPVFMQLFEGTSDSRVGFLSSGS